MKLLILGGTVFLGRHIVEQALAAGHEVTLFNRGQSNPELFGGKVEKIVGDRTKDLGLLEGRRFDACIDPSAYIPSHTEITGKALKELVDRYVLISSISVYPTFPEPGLDEDGTLAELPETVDPSIYDETYYGALKVLTERAIEREMPGRVLHVRSGLIVGPYDPTHRFTYWPVRTAQGGDMIAPLNPDYPISFIHAADQARWILQMLQQDEMGVYNVTSDNGSYTISDIISATEKVTNSKVNPVYVPSKFLFENKVAPWLELPLWLPESHLNMNRTSAKKAVANGMTLMPLEEVIRSTLDWCNSEPAQDWPAGLTPERESELLNAFSHWSPC